jgi:hypothetical protein
VDRRVVGLGVKLDLSIRNTQPRSEALDSIEVTLEPASTRGAVERR